MRVPEQVEKESALKVVRKLHRCLDLVGFVLLTGTMVMLLLALQFGGIQFPWSSSQIIGLFVGSGVTFIVWCFWNHHKGDQGLLPFTLLKRTAIYMSGINYLFLLATLYGGLYFLPIYFQAVKGDNAIMSGVNLLPLILLQIVSAVAGGAAGKILNYNTLLHAL